MRFVAISFVISISFVTNTAVHAVDPSIPYTARSVARRAAPTLPSTRTTAIQPRGLSQSPDLLSPLSQESAEAASAFTASVPISATQVDASHPNSAAVGGEGSHATAAELGMPTFQRPLELAPDMGAKGLIGRLVLGLTLAISLFASMVFLPRLFRARQSKSANRSEMELLDTIYVAPRCCLHLVSVQDQLVLVGRDATGMKEIVPIRSGFDSSLDASLKEAAMHGVELNDENLDTGVLGESGWT